MVTYKQAFHGLRAQLQALYDAGEATAIARDLLEGLSGMSYTQSLTAPDSHLPTDMMNALNYANLQLLEGRPLQYVLGYAWFMNRKYKVDEQVLIPRPETEELVQWIVDEWQNQPTEFSVLDIGAGSGCIPVSLKLEMDSAAVTSCDISESALDVARSNAAALSATVTFLQLDFLDITAQSRLPGYDVIVSNPPYIPVAEQESMHKNVRDYEPGTALFVPDEDALLFYRAIAAFAKTHLAANGAVYCELHKDYALATQALFDDAGFTTTLRKDLNGHWRMLKATMR